MLERPGEFFTVRPDASDLRERFLAPGEGFSCARVSVTMRTADNLAATDAAHDGCPIFSHIVGVLGAPPIGRNLGGAYFRLLRLDCTARRPGAIELDAWGDPTGRSSVQTAPGWVAGGTYRFVLEIVPFTSTLRAFDVATGAQIGPGVQVDISGSTIDMTRDAAVILGLPRPITGAYFPYYDAVYSDLVVEADVAPPVP